MGRRNRRLPGAAAAHPLTVAGERRELWRGEQYAVRAVTGHGATKPYRCPGCDHEVRIGVPHVVAWPAHDLHADDRRHWHTACWDARDRRRPSGAR